MVIYAIFQTPFILTVWKKTSDPYIIQKFLRNVDLCHLEWHNCHLNDKFRNPYSLPQQQGSVFLSQKCLCCNRTCRHTLLYLKELSSYVNSGINYMMYCNNRRTARTMIHYEECLTITQSKHAGNKSEKHNSTEFLLTPKHVALCKKCWIKHSFSKSIRDTLLYFGAITLYEL